MLILRPSQEAILQYRGGKMGIAAVPGSGKTWTLSLLAAEIISRGVMEDDQEVLVVTLVNSAVDNFYFRVSQFVQQNFELLPNLGYRVRTLHGLAHDIVRGRPDLAGLGDQFQIVDERAANAIRAEAARAWLETHPYALDDYLDPEMEEGKREWVRQEYLPDLVQSMAANFIRYAKDMQLTPEKISARLDSLPVPLHLAEMGASIYADYQRALAYRGGVDFDDLIRLALQALESDPDYLARLRYQWPYILEDEAQDSSRLQERILRLLTGSQGNWVRVGDPNQAIYETFTTANPRFLREFIRDPFVQPQALPHSGRSASHIIALANHLVDWTMHAHPVEGVRDALQAPPYIEPVPEGDPQPNPDDRPENVRVVMRRLTPQSELIAVVDSVERWLTEHTDETIAILTPRNDRGFSFVDELNRRSIPVVDDLLRSTTMTRSAAGVLGNILYYLANPGSSSSLARVYTVWRRENREDEAALARNKHISEILRKCNQVEDFIWPRPEHDWLDETNLEASDPLIYDELADFRLRVQRWQRSILLPVDQIILTLSQEFFTEPAELAISHKLAVLLRRAAQGNPEWRLPEMTEELAVIARNERRFIGFSEEDQGFDPDHHRGKVIVATMHKAKGLEFDRVYLTSVNNYDFPSGADYDTYMPEKWFARDRLNLEAETLAQLDAAFSTDQFAWYEEGVPTKRARLDYARERMRLLYVGLTRAKREVIITWNTGRKGDLQPALPLPDLQTFIEEDLRDEV